MTTSKSWLIYGAYGVTGQLVVHEAVQHGLRPILAGRSDTKLEEMGQTFGLEWISFDLSNKEAVKRALNRVELVLNLAGPFAHTAPLLVQACLETGTHYLDIANELELFQNLLVYHKLALQKKVAILPGVGFGTVATNFLAKKVARQMPEATHLEIAVAAYNISSSSGATGTRLEVMAGGGHIYDRGQLKPYRLGKGTRKLAFPDEEKTIMPVPSGDLVAAYQVTGIENVKVYTPFNSSSLTRLVLPAIQKLLKFKRVRKLTLSLADRTRGKATPPNMPPEFKHSYVWAGATNERGEKAESWLELGEGYQFTAMSSIKAVEKTLQGELAGVLFPAQAFEANFLAELAGVKFLEIDEVNLSKEVNRAQ
jgi:short subunit dehydrogenase-like uncharacterized protein